MEEAGQRDAASLADVTLSLKSVLSSILLSPSYSPVERSTILHDTRTSLIDQYRIHGSELDHIMSQPFNSLDDLTPLEYEIMHWDPIWTGMTEAGSHASGMEMLWSLIEHWKPHRAHGTANQSHELLDTSEGERPDPRYEFVDIVRRTCVRRLTSVTSQSARQEEDSANTLLQRLTQLIWSRGIDEENSQYLNLQRPTSIGAEDYSVSVAYDANTLDVDTKGESSIRSQKPSWYAGEDDNVNFTALVSVNDFAKMFRNGTMGKYTLDPDHLHEHVTSNSTSQSIIRIGNLSASPRLLLVDFLAAHRAWTLAIGRDELELMVHDRDETVKSAPGSELSSCTKATTSIESRIQAEVRLISPPAADAVTKDAIAEYVFTFPEICVVPIGSDKPERSKLRNAARIAPCFEPVQSEASASCHPSTPVVQFDDSRLLHGEELLLELRVKIRSRYPELEESATKIQPPTIDTPFAFSEADHIGANSSTWSEISAPAKFQSSLGVVSLASSDVVPGPPNFSLGGTESSWINVD